MEDRERERDWVGGGVSGRFVLGWLGYHVGYLFGHVLLSCPGR